MPFFSDLLPKTTNYPSTREGIKDALRDALRKYEQANARGLHSMECDRVAFVYAMCCMRVAKLLRMVTDRQTVGVTMYFLSVAAQKACAATFSRLPLEGEILSMGRSRRAGMSERIAVLQPLLHRKCLKGAR